MGLKVSPSMLDSTSFSVVAAGVPVFDLPPEKEANTHSHSHKESDQKKKQSKSKEDQVKKTKSTTLKSQKTKKVSKK